MGVATILDWWQGRQQPIHGFRGGVSAEVLIAAKAEGRVAKGEVLLPFAGAGHTAQDGFDKPFDAQGGYRRAGRWRGLWGSGFGQDLL